MGVSGSMGVGRGWLFSDPVLGCGMSVGRRFGPGVGRLRRAGGEFALAQLPWRAGAIALRATWGCVKWAWGGVSQLDEWQGVAAMVDLRRWT